MKRKGLIVLAAAAMLAIGASSMDAWAAESWFQSSGVWYYSDASGNKVTNAWKKGADNLWRYLDSNGAMAVNTWVEN
ncbi:MAG: cell wall-binding protein, partial [Lacrimispora sp.]